MGRVTGTFIPCHASFVPAELAADPFPTMGTCELAVWITLVCLTFGLAYLLVLVRKSELDKQARAYAAKYGIYADLTSCALVANSAFFKSAKGEYFQLGGGATVRKFHPGVVSMVVAA